MIKFLFNIEKSTLAKLKKECAKHGMSVGALIRNLIDDYLK